MYTQKLFYLIFLNKNLVKTSQFLYDGLKKFSFQVNICFFIAFNLFFEHNLLNIFTETIKNDETFVFIESLAGHDLRLEFI